MTDTTPPPRPVPAVDNSLQAHIVLLSCIMVMGFLEGIPLSFGIFQNHYQHFEIPGYQNSSWIGDTAIGLLYIGAPLMTYLCEERKMKPEYFIYAAWATCVLALVTAAFCTTVATLAVTQGLLLGLSALLVEMPGLIIINSWFVKRRGFAYGLLFSFADIFGAGWGYLARYLLDIYGLKITFLIFAATALAVPGIAISTFKSRPVQADTSVIVVETDDQHPANTKGLVCRPLFWILIAVTGFQSFAYYVPSIYLPTYNMQVLSGIVDCTSQNVNLLAVFNLAQIPGEFVFGWLSDRFNVHCLSVASSAVAGLATLLLWAGLIGDISLNFSGLMVFAGLFGAFGGGFLTTWGQLSMAFGQKHSQRLYSILSCVRGICTIASGPVSTALLRLGTQMQTGDTTSDKTQRGIDSRYGVLIMFVGCSMLTAATLAAVGWVASRTTDKRPVEPTVVGGGNEEKELEWSMSTPQEKRDSKVFDRMISVKEEEV